MGLNVERLLCVIAHPDDEAIGCGATLARAAEAGIEVRVLLPVRRTDERGIAAWPSLISQFEASAAALGATAVVADELVTEEQAEADLKALHAQVLPHVEWCDTVITHWPYDVHQVHRQVSRAVEVATRPFRRRRTVAFMEVATSTDQIVGPAFTPNLFVSATPEHAAKKVEAMRFYTSEHDPGRTPDDLHHQLRSRGRQIGAELAEAFVLARAFV